MGNIKILEQKQSVINEITEHVKDSAAVVFFEYRGLSVIELTQLRRKLKESDSTFKVYKNTLVRRALETLKIDVDQELVGPKAVAFGSDAIAPIKALSEFAKTHPALELKVGIVDGVIADAGTLATYASIPSREGLLTMLAGCLIGTVKDLSISLDLYRQQLEK